MTSDQLRTARETLGISRVELGNLAGVDAMDIHRMENGDDIGESKTNVLLAALEARGVRFVGVFVPLIILG